MLMKSITFILNLIKICDLQKHGWLMLSYFRNTILNICMYILFKKCTQVLKRDNGDWLYIEIFKVLKFFRLLECNECKLAVFIATILMLKMKIEVQKTQGLLLNKLK